MRVWLTICLLQDFVERARKKEEIQDDIVDEHSLLLFIKFSAERPKRDRRGQDIPGTFPGAVSVSLLHFLSVHNRLCSPS
jgi:hypothetical protein